jgi:glycosyltransferase involved in cell wall biosynthesis
VIDRSTAYPLWGLRAGRRAAELVAQGRVDLVHGFGASVLGYALKRRRATAKAPLVLNPQGLEEFGATDPSRARLKRAAYLPLRRSVLACAAAADAVIATDRALEPFVLQHLKLPRERMKTIPNALDLNGLDAQTDPGLVSRLRSHHLALDERVLLSVGRLEANKGFHVLLRALAAVRDHGGLDGRPWRWVALGDGPYRPTLETLAGELGLESHVHFLGRVTDEDMHAWHELSTLFVHPTLYEGSSLVTLEAMAHRRAVVASAAGGIPDKVRPGLNGWLVAPGDPASLAATISGALADDARLARYGLAGRAIVEREFSWTAVGDATVALYRQLLG